MVRGLWLKGRSPSPEEVGHFSTATIFGGVLLREFDPTPFSTSTCSSCMICFADNITGAAGFSGSKTEQIVDTTPLMVLFFLDSKTLKPNVSDSMCHRTQVLYRRVIHQD